MNALGFGLQRAIFIFEHDAWMMYNVLLPARNLKIYRFMELMPWSSCPIGHTGRNREYIACMWQEHVGMPSLFDSFVAFSAMGFMLSVENCCRIRTKSL